MNNSNTTLKKICDDFYILYGDFEKSKEPEKVILKGNNFKVVISNKAYKNGKIINKTFVLTSFSMIKK